MIGSQKGPQLCCTEMYCFVLVATPNATLFLWVETIKNTVARPMSNGINNIIKFNIVAACLMSSYMIVRCFLFYTSARDNRLQ